MVTSLEELGSQTYDVARGHIPSQSKELARIAGGASDRNSTRFEPDDPGSRQIVGGTQSPTLGLWTPWPSHPNLTLQNLVDICAFQDVFGRKNGYVRSLHEQPSAFSEGSEIAERDRQLTKKLFVGGLSWGTTDDMLRDAFEEFGDVEAAQVITDRDTGQSRGFGFVTFAEPADADKAMDALDGAMLDGRRIRVNEARSKARPPREGGGGGGGPRGDGPRGDRGDKHRRRR